MTARLLSALPGLAATDRPWLADPLPPEPVLADEDDLDDDLDDDDEDDDLDVIPILLLGVAGAIYLTIRLGRSLGAWRVLGVAAGLIAAYVLMYWVLSQFIQSSNRNLRVNLSYASLALIILVPLVVVLVRTRFRHVGWVAGGLASFGIAWFCRLVDGTPWDTLPMGTHWLWHTFGAITTLSLVEYFYRIEGENGEGEPYHPLTGRTRRG